MKIYLIINIATILFPLILSFENKLKFYKRLPALIGSILIVSTGYIWWDILATARTDWGFNSDYLLGLKIFNLPLEEVMFFITVPYAFTFLYETLSYYITDKRISFRSSLLIILVLTFLVTAFLFHAQDYTFTVLLACALCLLVLFFLNNDLLKSRNFWLFVVLSFLPFLVVNYILTSVPIVKYSPEAIWGIRFLTIPLEDFFYHFSLTAFYLLFYTKFRKI
ncbi:MAG: lycopene cyclase domain-containing protein [Melioribacteraceae bacterium]|nr:lycopene cyclase domain-containing protein [Melioribacteraceae bacterium]